MAEDEPVPPTAILMIDLDITVDDSWLKQYRHIAQLILESFGLTANAIRITPSRNRGYHVRIYLNNPVAAETANMLQLLLLDDHGRVNFNRARINVGFDEWSKLFESP